MAQRCSQAIFINSSEPKRPLQQPVAVMPGDVRSFCVLPYVKGTTELIKWVLNNNYNYNIKVALKPQQTHSLFPKPKDLIPKDQVHSIIYSIPGKDCDKLYIEETNW